MKSILIETPGFWRKRAPRIGIEIDQPGLQVTREPDWVEKALSGVIPYGERDDTIFRLAGHLKSKGIPEGEAIELLSLVAENRCEQPEGDKFTKEEVIKKIRSSYKGEGEVGRLNSLTLEQSLIEPLEEIPELVNYWVRIGDLTLLVGPGGLGKSTIALSLALSLAGGVPFLGFEVPSPEKVLYLDLEMGEYEFRTRLNTLGPQFPDIARQNFHWLSLPGKDVRSFRINREGDKSRLLNELDIIRPKLLVVDNHSRFHSGDANKEADMIPMVVIPTGEMIVEFNLGILYLMHTGWKERERPRGTMCIFDAASTMIAVTKAGDPRKRILKWQKNRSVRRQQGPTRLSTLYDPETFMVETGEHEEISSVFQETVFPIKRNDFVERLKEDLGVGKTRAYNIIRELAQQGEIIIDGDIIRLGPEDIEL